MYEEILYKFNIYIDRVGVFMIVVVQTMEYRGEEPTLMSSTGAYSFSSAVPSGGRVES
jgi:hypothetical protein